MMAEGISLCLFNLLNEIGLISVLFSLWYLATKKFIGPDRNPKPLCLSFTPAVVY